MQPKSPAKPAVPPAILAAAALVTATLPLPAHAADVGTFDADARARYETADIDGFDEADNLSGRLRLGYTSPAWQGLQAAVGGEFTGIAHEDGYNAAGVHGNPDKAVIADPKNIELDQAFLAYTNALGTLKAGRQAIALDNHRFIGDVAWRQNRQTYDAAAMRATPLPGLQAFYGYVDRVVRIFGSEAPDSGPNAGDTDSSSHLLNAAYAPATACRLTAYAYLLDLDDLPPTSSVDTFGASLAGGMPLREGLQLDGRAEFATQTDASGNTLDYQADYYAWSVDATVSILLAGAGYEVLGAENTGTFDADGSPVFASFQTPLATLHKFNGFADRFLVTPPTGLIDTYASLGCKLPLSEAMGPLTAQAIYHDFQAAEGPQDLGDEWDGVLTKPLKFNAVPGEFKAIAKVAFYRKGDVGADTDRASIEMNYATTF